MATLPSVRRFDNRSKVDADLFKGMRREASWCLSRQRPNTYRQEPYTILSQHLPLLLTVRHSASGQLSSQLVLEMKC